MVQNPSVEVRFLANVARLFPGRETLLAAFFALLLAKMALPIPALALYVPTAFVIGALFVQRASGAVQHEPSRRSVLAMLLFFATVAFYLAGILKGGGVLYQNNRVDSVGLVIAATLPWLLGGPARADTALLWLKLQKWVWLACVGISVLSIIKFVALLNGQEIPFLSFIYQLDGRDYPGGTALTTDYNFYSLCLLVGVLSAARLATDAASPRLLRFLSAVSLPVISASVLFAGSRRGWVGLAVLAIAGAAVYAKRVLIDRGNPVGRNGGLLIALLLAGSVALGGMYATLQGVDGLGEIERLWTRFGTITGEVGTFDESFGSRIDSWDFGLKEIIPRYSAVEVAFGRDFSYLKRYAREFPIYYPTEYYPHNPIISAIHYSGLFGAAAVMLLLISSAIYVLHLSRKLGLFAFLTCVLFLTFNFVSNNSIFSAPAFIAILVLVQVSETVSRAEGLEPVSR